MTQIPVDLSSIVIKPFQPADEIGVAELVTAAFGQRTEADLVYKLRHCGAFVLELVATTAHGRLLAHVGFSRVTPSGVGRGQELAITCLAPMSVWPEFQREGIGGKLIEAGVAALKERGEDLVLVLGPPTYYPRFGFDPVLATKVSAPYAGQAFMALALNDAVEQKLPVEVAFPTPFQEL